MAAAAPSAGSEMVIRFPHFLHRTTSRLPLTLSSAMCSVALHWSQENCMAGALYNKRPGRAVYFFASEALSALSAFSAFFFEPRALGTSEPVFCIL